MRQQPNRTPRRHVSQTSPRADLTTDISGRHNGGSVSSRSSSDDKDLPSDVFHIGVSSGTAALRWTYRRSMNSSDDKWRPEVERRPQSAWNSRSGRRPQFTFSDLDATGGNDEELSEDRLTDTKNATRRRSTGCRDGCTSTTTSKRTSKPRASQIPVLTDRLHPTTINHVDDGPRRHSVYVISSGNTTTTMLDLSRDPTEEDGSKSRGRQRVLESRQSKAGITSSCSEHSLTAARRRVLARLAGTQSLPSDTDTTGYRPLPRKLDPVFPSATFSYDEEDEERIVFMCE